MSKRLDPKLWEEVAEYLARRDGRLCAYCSQPLPQPLRSHAVPERERTTINHIDHNKDDYHLENLNLMHRHCNISDFADFNRKARLTLLLGVSELPAVTPPSRVSGERADKGLPRFRIVPGSSDAYSNRKNHECMPLYFKFVFAKVKGGVSGEEKEYYSYDEINDAIAMRVGEVPNTTGRYLNMLISEAGPLKQAPHPVTNKEVIFFRAPEYEYLTCGELMELFPPDGLRNVDPGRQKALIAEAESRMIATAAEKLSTA